MPKKNPHYQDLIKTKALAGDKKVIMTFVNFNKAYDSVYRDTLINILEEFEIDNLEITHTGNINEHSITSQILKRPIRIIWN